jgi:hypothetical protein
LEALRWISEVRIRTDASADSSACTIHFRVLWRWRFSALAAFFPSLFFFAIVTTRRWNAHRDDYDGLKRLAVRLVWAT